MEGKSSTQNAQIERFFKRFLPIKTVRCPTFLKLKIYHDILAKLPRNATEIVKFLKEHKNWAFLNNRYFSGKTWIFFKIA